LIVFQARQHPGESCSSFVAEQIVSSLTAGCGLGASLL
jgi:hypothetical protein